ncbi:MAG: sensor domain-containing phosphodiesterase [Sulfobacillus sp.]
MGLPLDQLWLALQPVVNLQTGEVLGHEGLIRGPVGSPWPTPDLLFAEAARSGQQRELERTCRQLAFLARKKQAVAQTLFMNVSMDDPDLPLNAKGRCVRPETVALEISEQQEILHNPEALHMVRRWRAAGHKIVLDDYGTGHASLGTLLAIQPDMVKIDRYIMAGLDHDRQRRVAVEAVAQLAWQMGVAVVVEGVETIGELRALRKLGIEYAQGFLLGRPISSAAADPCPVVVQEQRVRQAVTAVPLRPTLDAEAAQLFHQTLLDSFAEAIYFVDRRRTLLQWNRAAEEISGFSRREVVGRRCMDHILDHVDLQGTPLCSGLCPLVHAMADGGVRQELILLRHKDGHRVRVITTVIPVRNEDGRIIGALEVFQPEQDVISSSPGGLPKAGELHLRPELLALGSVFSGNRKSEDG